MNPILQRLQENRQPQQSDLSQLYRSYRLAQNPKQIIDDLIKQNPVLAPIVSSNADLKQVFYDMCKERKVNPEDILSQFK